MRLAERDHETERGNRHERCRLFDLHRYGSHVRVDPMNPDRPKWKTGTDPDEPELRSAVFGSTAYCGRYDVKQVEGYVDHHVEISVTPNSVGINRRRYFTFKGDRLMLRVAPPLPQGVVEWTVVWERVRK